MANFKSCPHCGHTMLLANIAHPAVIQVNDVESDNPKDKYDIVKQLPNEIVEILGCYNCKQKISEDELVSGKQCVECGRIVSPAYLDENGVCDVCRAKKEEPELENMTKDELIRMYLQAKLNNSKGISKAKKALEDKPEELENESTNDEQPEEQTEEKKPVRRKRSVKKATTRKTKKETEKDTNEESPKDESADDNDVVEKNDDAVEKNDEEVENDIAKAEEAPFPDVEPLSETPPVPEEPVPKTPQPEEPVQDDSNGMIGMDNGGFEMFDNSEGSVF